MNKRIRIAIGAVVIVVLAVAVWLWATAGADHGRCWSTRTWRQLPRASGNSHWCR
jgi:hypothetical protein